VPGIVISPYAKRGYVDHQVLRFDAYLKFIEDDFLNGGRLDPKTDGRPDTRPDGQRNCADFRRPDAGLQFLTAGKAAYDITRRPSDNARPSEEKAQARTNAENQTIIGKRTEGFEFLALPRA
jgi:hypothetical protein